MPGVTWAEWDQAGRLVYAREGKLLAGDLVTGTLAETVIADLDGDRFNRRESPAWATEWPAPTSKRTPER
jgi:hypothetical protein